MTLQSRPNPYVGPRAFQDGETLYGRDREVKKLLNLLIAERIVLLYSPSGAGKTSLIQAALIHELREEGFRVLPVIRVGLEPPPDLELPATTNRYILSILLSLEEGLPPEQQTPLEELVGMDLTTYLGQWLAEAGEADGDVLIFDQFEEILTVDPTDQKAKAAFFDQLGKALRPRDRWVLFAMREEYPAGLDPYLRPVPTRLSTTFRLELLGAKAAHQAMQEPAHQAGVPFTDTAAAKLIDDLRRVQMQQPDGTTAERPGLYIEPVQLQVVCYRLWENLPDNATEIRETDIQEAGDVDSALAGYYADRVKATAETASVRERTIREWFNGQLITEQGIRGQVLRGPEQSQGLANKAIEPLVDAHLVRAENRRGATWYELAHDRLIEPIRKNNAEWFQTNLSTLQRQAALWDEQHRPEGLLLHDKSLDEAEQWAATHQTDMTQNEQEFLAACRKARAIIEQERRLTEELRVLTVKLQEKLAESERQNRISLAQLLSFQALDQQLYYKDTLSALLARQAYLLNEQAQAMTGWVQIDKALRSAVDALCFKSVILTHAQQVGGVAFSPDGKILASGDWEGAVRLWDVTTGTELTVLRGHTGPVTSVAFSPDGQTLASASGDWTIRLWDVADRRERTVLRGHQEQLHSVAFSPDGLTLASGSQDQTIRLWDVASGREQAVLQGHTKGVRSVTFSPDGATLASGSYDQTVRLWDVASKQERKMLWHSATLVRAIAFSPDGQTLASGCHDQTIRLWDVASGKQQVVLRGHKSLVDALAFSPDGQTLASVSWDNTVRLWNIDSGQELKILRGHTRLVFSVAFSPDGKILASGSWDTTARLWDVTIEQESNVLRGHEVVVTTVAFSPDGHTLASGSWDKTIRLWDATNGIEQAILQDQRVWSVAFSPNGRVLASGSADHTIRLWDVIKKQEQAVLRGHEDAVRSVVFSPDGKTLASGSWDTTIRLWDMITGKERAVLQGHEMAVDTVAFNPDGQTLASASRDEIIRLWDVASGKERTMLQCHTASRTLDRFVLAFSPDGKILAWGGSQDNSIWLWDVASQQERVVLQGHDLMVHSLAFSPDGKTLASGSEDHTVRLWDTTNGTERAILRGHERGVVAVAFSPDGQTLASSSGDHTIRLWNWRTEMLAEMVCDKVWRNLTMEEWHQFVSPDIPYERTCPNLPPGDGAPSDAPEGTE